MCNIGGKLGWRKAVSLLSPERWLEELARRGYKFHEIELRGSPDKKHWHIRLPTGSGTLDATFDPVAGELLLELRLNRVGDWTDEKLKEVLEAACSASG